jgi:3-phosphoshikimate 1-carboxyvinyltransferase
LSATVRLRAASGPLDAIVEVPGSKSIANRALVCAALADGESELVGIPSGDDTRAMTECLTRLGVAVSAGPDRALVTGTRGRLAARAVRLDAGLAGTTSRFVTAMATLAPGPVTIDGDPPLRRRPMGPLHDALLALGADVRAQGGGGHLPVTVTGPLRHGGKVELSGDVSSQFLTALMLIGPLLEGGLEIALSTPLVSVPYVELTARVMAAFAVEGVDVGGTASSYRPATTAGCRSRSSPMPRRRATRWRWGPWPADGSACPDSRSRRRRRTSGSPSCSARWGAGWTSRRRRST